uniref:E3 ubiquitin-protein ligase listerin n=1 Tax=Ciona intestinalis TaxID=7719 RepID=UPI000EF55B59|nr:E3 ubiquitin-protein ligase listerin [Ciona intestinalis]|eukprot:XP_026692800.1 E3 ubiquitin-protein ligase listerin [Ciona intestinalis]
MGKQKGQSKRTKGNAVPSSSGRAATSFSQLQGVVGFASFSGDLGYVPVLKSIEDDSEGLVSPDFRVALCKLTKRDVTTKLKALTELRQLIEDNESETSVAILPYWSRIYNRLCEDTDRRVRESIQQAHHNLVCKVGKQIAPFLKGLFGAWWIATCDTYALAASAAHRAFVAAFPTTEKQEKVLDFCHVEIMGAIKCNVFQSQQDAKDAEEMERITSVGLAGLAGLISAAKSMEKLEELIKEGFLANSRFWKLPKHKSSSIRSAFYSVITSVCDKEPSLLQEFLNQACKAVLSNLNEPSSVVCASLWLAAEQLVLKFPNWHENIDIRKGFLPAFWGVIKSGFQGNAKIICPHVLPVLGCFPDSLLVFPIYKELLTCFQVSLDVDSVRGSLSETRAVVTSMMECLQLAVRKSIETSSEPDLEIVNYALNEHLIPIFKKSILDPDSNKYIPAPLHHQVVELLGTFSQKANTEIPKQNCYENISSLVWKNISHFFSELTLNEDKGKQFFVAVLKFLAQVKAACYGLNEFENTVSAIRKPGVRFSEDISTSVAEIKINKANAHVVNSHLFKELESSVNVVLVTIMQSQLPTDGKVFRASLILENFSTVSLFTKLFHSLNESSMVTGETDYILQCLQNNFLPCISQIKPKEPESEKHCASLLYSCLKLSGQKAATVLQDIFASPTIYGVGVCTLLANDILKPNEEVTPQWVRRSFTEDGSSFITFIFNAVSSEPELMKENVWALLSSTLLADSPIFDMKLNFKIFQKIVKTAENCEASDCDMNAKACLLMTQFVTSDVFDTQYLSQFKELMLPLFDNLLHDAFYRKADSLQGFKGIIETLKTSMTREEEIKDFTTACFNKYVSYVADTIIELASNENLNKILPNVKEVVDILAASCALLADNQFCNFLAQLLPNEETWLQNRDSMTSNVWLDTTCLAIGPIHSTALEENKFHAEYICLVDAFNQVLSQVIQTLQKTEQTNKLCLTYSNQHVKQLCVEALLVESHTIHSEKNDLINLFMQDQAWCKDMLFTLASNSIQTGRAWLSCFSQLLQKAKQTTHWDPATLLNKLNYANQNLTDCFSSTIISIIFMCDSKHCLTALLNWILPKTLSFSDSFNSIFNGKFVNEFSILVHVFKKLLSFPDTENMLLSICEQIIEQLLVCKSSCSSVFLFDTTLTDNIHQLLFNSVVAQFFECAVQCSPTNRTSEFWDFVQCSLVSWLESICLTFEVKNFENHNKFQHHLCLIHAVSSLFLTLDNFLTAPTTIEHPTYPSSLTREWHEFFQPAAHSTLVPIFCAISLKTLIQFTTIFPLFQQCLRNISTESIISATSRLTAHMAADSDLPDETQTLLHHLSQALEPRNNSHTTQCIAYNLLCKVVENIFQNTDGVSPSLKPPRSLLRVLNLVFGQTNQFCSSWRNIFLQMVWIFTLLNILAYLLVWKILVKCMHPIPADMKSQFISALKDSGFDTDNLLSKLLKLMPFNPYRTVENKTLNMFSCEIDFQAASKHDFMVIHHIACSLFKDLLTNLPVLMRAWYNDLGKVTKSAVNEYTTKHISGVICNKELKSICVSQNQDDFDVVARPASKEVVATYQITDAEFVISIQLPTNYPLSPVQVNTVRKAGVKATQWRYWILQMTMLLRHQNGQILDALYLWKEKVDKRLHGLEECMICFSVVHGSNSQSLPKLQCKTCKKKYHAECLYKWFDTSNQSTCPLCRTPMMLR